MHITLLGSGDTLGVPVMGALTQPDMMKDARNKRTRFGILIEHAGKKLLIDANPDLKWQCLERGFALNEVEAVLITHTHFDHVNGLSEFWQRREVPTTVYHPADPLSQKNVEYFRYLEGEKVLQFLPCTSYEPILLWNRLTVLPMEVNHNFPCFGFLLEADGKRIGILTDTRADLPRQTIEKLQGCDLLFVDVFSETLGQVEQLYREMCEPVPDPLETHWFHMTIEEARSLQQQLKAKTACTVHMSHLMSTHEELVRKHQTETLIIGYDGMEYSL